MAIVTKANCPQRGLSARVFQGTSPSQRSNGIQEIQQAGVWRRSVRGLARVGMEKDQHLKKKRSISVDKKKAIVVTSVVVMLALIISLVCWLVMKKARRDVGFNNEASDEEKLELPIFDMITIAAATNKFSDTNKIGEGGFGPVYKVCLFHCSIVS
ncbi:G-type lectin S-receptor-like serine/threonine-protein kinase RKS1 [Camellia lanceoleosa]|uniref:G-type lectin S-receptor-like serine/threonine-protein kinase RKS1 n=1 Tax=Camellia lanceoleosa TaxID=1840588 RepID=A0ACC0FFY2_9ERIC|nr:G-type lectin S-receptor-like serine/threonine-protein kinase RKS1 [Camellia lanceoleosa]